MVCSWWLCVYLSYLRPFKDLLNLQVRGDVVRLLIYLWSTSEIEDPMIIILVGGAGLIVNIVGLGILFIHTSSIIL
jgi:hypothetical protein